MVEIGFKIIATIVSLLFVYLFLSWLWTHQIDVKETLMGPFKKKTENPAEWIATRDPNAIYQNNSIVGNVTAGVSEESGKILFREICNTTKFDRTLPFEYKREKLKVIRVGSTIGLDIRGSDRSTAVRQNVLEQVLCERIK